MTNSETHWEILTEELSGATMLECLLRRHLPDTMTYRVITFNGRENLMDRLPERLKAYREWIPSTHRIIVLTDRDEADCRARKEQIEGTARAAGFATKTTPNGDGGFQFISRLAIEELEAWFFGDVAALRAVYPDVSERLDQQRRYRDPDAIRGGTAETLLRVLQEAGYYRGLSRLPKLEVARRVGEQLQPDRNRSHSFYVFWNALVNP